MASLSDSMSNAFPGIKTIARIVGFTCFCGFIVDIIALTFPIGEGAAWRVGLLQQMGDRSIVLLFGLALILLSFWDNKQLRKPFSYAALGVGVLFLLFCILIIRDSLVLQSLAADRIGQQASELQTQVEQNQTNSEITENASPEDFDEALRLIDSRARSMKQNAKTSITRVGITSVGNFIVVGIGLLSLGRVGIGSGGSASFREGTSKLRKQR